MGKVLRLFWPRTFGAYLVSTMALLLLLFFLATAAMGQFDLQELQRDGSYQTFPVSQVLERDDTGAPSAVLADLSTLNGQHPRIDNVQGSMVGQDRIELRLTQGGELIMAAQDYRGHHVWLEVLKVCLLPLLGGLIAIAAINYRSIFLIKEVPSQWAVQTDHGPAGSRG